MTTMATTTITTAEVQRDYIKEYSHSLGRDMELLHFGHAGRPLLVFPTSMGRFYQWEDFGLIGGLSDFIESGAVQLICVDSVDGESWYAKDRPVADRVRRHLQYEAYIVDEIDEKALEIYQQSGFSPPTRPSGFLDDSERGMWNRWRQKAVEALLA